MSCEYAQRLSGLKCFQRSNSQTVWAISFGLRRRGTIWNSNNIARYCEFGMRPYYLGVADAVKITPGMDEIKPRDGANAEAHQLANDGFVIIPGVLDRAAKSGCPVVPVWKPLIDAEHLVLVPVFLPLPGIKAAGQMNKNAQRRLIVTSFFDASTRQRLAVHLSIIL